MPPLSLLGHLGNARSPLRAWFVEELANTRAATAAGNAALCGTPRAAVCVVEPEPGAEAGLVGTAVDYAVRASLSRDEPLTASSARAGAAMLERASGGRSGGVMALALGVVFQLAPACD